MVFIWQLLEKSGKPQFPPPIMIGVPHTDKFSFRWIAHVHAIQPPAPMILMGDTGHPVDLTRNIMVSHALVSGCSHLFFLDSDVIVKPDTLTKLFDSGMPIVSAIYFSRSPPYQIVASINGHEISHEMVGQDTVMEVERVGMGCCLIDCRVFHRIGKSLDWQCLLEHPLNPDRPEEYSIYAVDYDTAKSSGFRCKYCKGLLVARFFEDRTGKTLINSISEDFYFCHLARSFGYHIMLNCNAGDVEHEVRTFIIHSTGLTNTANSADRLNADGGKR